MMRGGTSKGANFLASDLPDDSAPGVHVVSCGNLADVHIATPGEGAAEAAE